MKRPELHEPTPGCMKQPRATARPSPNQDCFIANLWMLQPVYWAQIGADDEMIQIKRRGLFVPAFLICAQGKAAGFPDVRRKLKRSLVFSVRAQPAPGRTEPAGRLRRRRRMDYQRLPAFRWWHRGPTT